MDALADYHPAVWTSPRGWLSVTITVPAENLRQAAATALAVVEQAAGAPAVSIDVMATDEFDARAGFVPVPDLVGTSEAAEILGVSRQRVLQLARSGALPASPVGGKALAFPRSAVEARRKADAAQAS